MSLTTVPGSVNMLLREPDQDVLVKRTNMGQIPEESMAEKKPPEPAGSSKPADAKPGGYEISPHPLAPAMQPLEHGHTRVVTLTGYPGASAIKGKFRLYLDQHFQSYYEIDNQHLVHDWDSITGDKHSPRHVAIRSEATPHLVVHTAVTTSAAAFLNGHLVASYLSTAIESASFSAGGGVATPPPPPPPHGVVVQRMHTHPPAKGEGYEPPE
jgi:hypothetical protein